MAAALLPAAQHAVASRQRAGSLVEAEMRRTKTNGKPSESALHKTSGTNQAISHPATQGTDTYVPAAATMPST